MDITTDFDAFFLDFGLLATVAGQPVDGIFDNAFLTSLGFTAGSAPTLLIAHADAPSVAQGDAVVVASVNYTVTAIEPDGTGLALLRLQEA